MYRSEEEAGWSDSSGQTRWLSCQQQQRSSLSHWRRRDEDLSSPARNNFHHRPQVSCGTNPNTLAAGSILSNCIIFTLLYILTHYYLICGGYFDQCIQLIQAIDVAIFLIWHIAETDSVCIIVGEKFYVTPHLLFRGAKK